MHIPSTHCTSQVLTKFYYIHNYIYIIIIVMYVPTIMWFERVVYYLEIELFSAGSCSFQAHVCCLAQQDFTVTYHKCCDIMNTPSSETFPLRSFTLHHLPPTISPSPTPPPTPPPTLHHTHSPPTPTPIPTLELA